MKTIAYSLYSIADLDFRVEKGILERLTITNFQPFRQQREGLHPCLFTLNKGNVPLPEGEASAFNDLEFCSYKAWIGDMENIIAFQPAGTRYSYRLKADRYWKKLVMDLGEGQGEYYDLAVRGLMMAAFAYSAAFYDAVLMHASAVKQEEDWGVAFIGPSGAGKSTHSQLWLDHIMGTSLLNDDQPVVRLVDEKPYLFGSPWSGKTPCYKNEKARLLAVYEMVQAKENKLTPKNALALFPSLLSSCALIKEDAVTFDKITQTVARLCSSIKGYTLESRPEREAALLTYGAAKALATI